MVCFDCFLLDPYSPSNGGVLPTLGTIISHPVIVELNLKKTQLEEAINFSKNEVDQRENLPKRDEYEALYKRLLIIEAEIVTALIPVEIVAARIISKVAPVVKNLIRRGGVPGSTKVEIKRPDGKSYFDRKPDVLLMMFKEVRILKTMLLDNQLITT